MSCNKPTTDPSIKFIIPDDWHRELRDYAHRDSPETQRAGTVELKQLDNATRLTRAARCVM